MSTFTSRSHSSTNSVRSAGQSLTRSWFHPYRPGAEPARELSRVDSSERFSRGRRAINRHRARPRLGSRIASSTICATKSFASPTARCSKPTRLSTRCSSRRRSMSTRSRAKHDPVVQLIDFAHPERNQFHAINQFRIDTPGCVKSLHHPRYRPVRERHSAGGGRGQDRRRQHWLTRCTKPSTQFLRYRNGRPETTRAGLREGEPRLFYTNHLLIRTCGEKAEFGTITSGHEHFFAWKDIWPEERPRVHAATWR